MRKTKINFYLSHIGHSSSARLYINSSRCLDGISFEISLGHIYIQQQDYIANECKKNHLIFFKASLCLSWSWFPRKRKWNEKPTNLNAKSYTEGLQGHLCNN